jgi:hypothetical protein
MAETGVEINLSAKGLANLPRNVYENDFTFIVGESRYHCPSFIASFLSPRICHLQANDATLREFCIETDDPTHLFEKILAVCYGSSFRIYENISFFRSLCCELSNRELYEQIVGKFEEDLTILNVIDRIQFLFSANESCDREIEFCSSHFYELDLTAAFSLPFEIISSIISNDSIRLKDEESLYDLITSRQSEDSRFSSLLEHVRFEYLSSESMQSFIKLINDSFDRLTFPIWRSLCHRLSLSVLVDSFCDRFIGKGWCVSPTCPPSSLNGIISFLTTKFGGHVIDREIVSITTSSVGNPERFPLRLVADFANRSVFHTTYEANSWICYDFKDMRLKVTDYSIRARYDCNRNHLRFWILEGSNDGSKWVVIDNRTNDTSLNSPGSISTFSISSGFQQEFRMIRLRQTGKDSSDQHYLCFSAIEFFGVVKELKR